VSLADSNARCHPKKLFENSYFLTTIQWVTRKAAKCILGSPKALGLRLIWVAIADWYGGV